MALATKCPHCNTTFRVASDQLKLRGGIVRCGTCQQVFDGNAALVDLDAVVPVAASEPVQVEKTVDVVAAVEAATADHVVDAPETNAETIAAPFPEALEADIIATLPPPDDEDAAAGDAHPPLPGPDYELDYDLSEPESTPEPEEASQPEPVAIVAPVASFPLDFDLGEPAQLDSAAVAFDLGQDSLLDRVDPVAAPRGELSLADEEAFSSDAPDTRGAPSVLPGLDGPLPLLRESAADPAADMAAAPAPDPAPRPARAMVLPVDDELDLDEPEFVRLAREKELAARRRRLTMGGGSVLLALVLVLHGAYVFRDLLAARVPALKPTLVAACQLAGCKIALPAQIESQSIEGPDLQTLPNGNLVLTALLRNGSSLPQAWPYIELELTDADRKPLIRRVFTPRQYLPANVAVAKGFPAASEQPVKIHFSLKQTKASGFNIGVFYP